MLIRNIFDICINKKKISLTYILIREMSLPHVLIWMKICYAVTELLHTMFYTINGGGSFS